MSDKLLDLQGLAYYKSKSDIELAKKTDKVINATANNFAGLDANGNLIDSDHKASDFATAAQGAKADTALQTHQDISGKENTSNKVTSLSSSSTDTQYPSAKCVYDSIAPHANAVNTTWSALKSLRDNNQLVPGRQYRITDYTCTTIQENTQSAGHVFDIIVTALDESTLSEQAGAIQHSGDTYFANNDLNAWRLWYCLDNDTNRFAWADSTNGKGVIYRMIDEFNNDVPYDFKNIQFKRDLKDLPGTQVTSSESVWCYTFSCFDEGLFTNAEPVDESVVAMDHIASDESGDFGNNMFLGYYVTNIQTLNNNVFIVDWTNFALGHSGIRFGVNCYNNTCGTSEEISVRIILGNDCYNNTFGNGCYNNTFGNDCQNNTFGNDCQNNTFGSKCYNNTFGNDCYENTFGNCCYYNTFGNSCFTNTFGNDCYNNTFGNDCYRNTFGNDCQYNTFGTNGKSNTFGNSCQYIKFGGSSNTKSYYQYIIVENGNQYIYLNCTSTTSGSNFYQNVTIAQGVNNTYTYKTITDSNIHQFYKTTYQPARSQTINVQ